MKPLRIPVNLPLLPGLRWSGKLRVESRIDGDFVIAFDAEVVGAVEGDARFVYDRALFTPAQLLAWTGIAPSAFSC